MFYVYLTNHANEIRGLKTHLHKLETKVNNMAIKLSEIPGALAALSAQLDKAKTEILAKIASLEQSDPDLSPAGEATLASLKTVAQNLDDIVPG